MNKSANDDAEPLATAQQLGESFAALVGGRDWQIDDLPIAEPVASAAEVAELPPQPAPPMAEPVNETTIPPAPMQIIEAMLFVGGPPLTSAEAVEAIRGLSSEQFADCIAALNRTYQAQNRPYAIASGPAGHVLRVTRRYAAMREKLYGGPREARLSQQALDVLSLVAYRQPVGKTEIDSMRGQDSGAIVRQLVRLGLVSAAKGADDESMLSTTERFLEIFRLRDLDDLPQIGEATRIE